MNKEQHFDLVIIGSGPAGMRAARKALMAGIRTALVEADLIGGTCLNAGCVPTKYLLGGTSLVPHFHAQGRYKVVSGNVEVNFSMLQSRKDRFISGTRDTVQKELVGQGLSIFTGKASFADSETIDVASREGVTKLTFEHCVVATGSIPATFPNLKPDGVHVLSSTDLLNVQEVPKKLIIVGAGVIGIELAEIFHRLGSKVELAGRMDRILPMEDPETSEFMHNHFIRQGWKLHAGKGIAAAHSVEDGAVVTFDTGEEVKADKVLIAVGRRPNVADLGLENAGITKQPNGYIQTDQFLRCARHIYAIGDVNGRTLLAHAGEHQGSYVVSHIAGRTNATYNPPAMPACIYGTMELMRVGPTEQELYEKREPYSITRSVMAANVIPVSCGHPQGFVKILWTENRLRSICAVGYGVSHLVTAAAELVAAAPEKDTPIPFIFSHPTIDEAIESAMLSPLVHVNPFHE